MSSPDIIKIAILAVGGQGGGVLTQWIVTLAETNGWQVQSTAVAGVAQRTGATIYYLEMSPGQGRAPVFALAPSAGDVDVLIAAELMEAGRAVLRGFVTPDRTTLIASTHRIHAVSEKVVPGDGQASQPKVLAAIEKAAKHLQMADYQDIAVQAGSVISASLFGALAAADVLPFPRTTFTDVIKASGHGADASLRAFEAVVAGTSSQTASQTTRKTNRSSPRGPARLKAAWSRLADRAAAMPNPVQSMVFAGLESVVDFQDVAYGSEYLDHLDRFVALDGGDYQMSVTAAKYVANAMTYDDVIRVADLKTRASRFSRVRQTMGLASENVSRVTEFMHPRAEEACGLLPARLGAWVDARPRVLRMVDRLVNRGKKVRTSALPWFVVLYLLAGMKGWRRHTFRHRVEAAHLRRWMSLALEAAQKTPELATEILACQRLVKGYSDTHARSEAKLDKVLGALPALRGHDDAANRLRRLRDAALEDEEGTALDNELQRMGTATQLS